MPASEPLMERVRETRRAAGLTQAALAARAGVSLATLQNIEAGRANPALATLRKILSSLGLEIGVRPRAVDWDALVRLGLPLTPDRAADGDGDGDATALPALVRHAALELALHEAPTGSPRVKDALRAMLWALRSHFPTTYRAWFGGCREVAALTPTAPTGREIKLSRIAKQRLAELL